jgi:hypothetical protein
MKTFLAAFLFLSALCIAQQVPITFAPPSIVQSTGSVTASGTTVTATLTPIAGDTWIAECAVNNTGTIAVSDGNSNTWNTAKSQTGTTAGVLISYAINATAGSTTVTCTAGSSGVVAVELYEVRGLLQQIPAQPDSTDAGTGSAALAVLNAGISPSSPNEILFAPVMLTTNNAGTAGASWTLDTQQGATGGRLLPARQSLAKNIPPSSTIATFTSAAYAMAAATFKPVVLGVASDGTISALRCNLVSAASTNATLCKATAGNVYGWRFVNTTGTLYYLRMYNLTTSPTCSSATGFVESIPIPASTSGAGFAFMEPMGEAYSTGISFCFTGGSSSTDNTNAATGVFGTILYK